MSVPYRGLLPLLLVALVGCDSGEDSPPAGYTVAVTAEGLSGPLQVQNNRGNTLNIPANGHFRFTGRVQHGGAYDVTVLLPPAGQACGVQRGNGHAVADVVDVRVVCVPTGALLNDTGVDWCADATQNRLSCPVSGLPLQDAERGRDARATAGTLLKVGSGRAGFDFLKLRANGRPLVIQDVAWSETGSESAGSRWSCVRDNHTGLYWEVKNNDPASLHYHASTYTWYNTDPSSNGGTSGTAAGGTAAGGTCSVGTCDTQSFVAAVNAAGLCGFNDWRLPSPREAETIVDFGLSQPAIDTHFFPHVSSNQNPGSTPHIYYWTGMPQASYTNTALAMRMDFGNTHSLFSTVMAFHVRLVRSAP